MNDAFLCDGTRTPFGRYGGALASVRTDELAALHASGAIAGSAETVRSSFISS